MISEGKLLDDLGVDRFSRYELGIIEKHEKAVSKAIILNLVLVLFEGVCSFVLSRTLGIIVSIILTTSIICTCIYIINSYRRLRGKLIESIKNR